MKQSRRATRRKEKARLIQKWIGRTQVPPWEYRLQCGAPCAGANGHDDDDTTRKKLSTAVLKTCVGDRTKDVSVESAVPLWPDLPILPPSVRWPTFDAALFDLFRREYITARVFRLFPIRKTD